MNKKTNNYILLLGLIFITCIIFLYLFSWYKQYKNIKLDTPKIADTLTEVKYNNLDSILQERNFLVIYMCTSRESKCRNFENEFKYIIEDNNLNNEIFYLNLGKNKVNNDTLDTIYNKYKSSDLIKKPSNYPIIFIFNNGKIIDLLSSNNSGNLSSNSAKDFLEGYDLIND